MTELKSTSAIQTLDINELSSGETQELNLSEKSEIFLHSEYRSKFMTPFIVGSNKLQLYGHIPL